MLRQLNFTATKVPGKPGEPLTTLPPVLMTSPFHTRVPRPTKPVVLNKSRFNAIIEIWCGFIGDSDAVPPSLMTQLSMMFKVTRSKGYSEDEVSHVRSETWNPKTLTGSRDMEYKHRTRVCKCCSDDR